ncbi:MAG: UbiA family prenyltransferase [Nocardioidaceae bacterium]
MSISAPTGSRVLSLVLACHPVPTFVVTSIAAVLALVAENAWPTVLLIDLAVLTGQLSIGWSNDAWDARRDAQAGRTDKPVATGALSARAAWTASIAAAVSTGVLSAALGWRAGCTQLLIVASGWIYNARLKSTPLSAVPFFTAFGALPAVATFALPNHPRPPAWVLVAAGLIGVAAHFGNVLPDLDEDRLTGVRGLPHLLGRSGASVAATTCALGGTGLALWQISDPSGLAWLLGVAAAGCAAVALLAVRHRPTSEAAFYATMLVAGIDVALIATSGTLV